LASLLSLIAIGAHYLRWDLRFGGDLDPLWATEADPRFEVARDTIAIAVTTVSLVAAILVVVVPIAVWALRRSPWWPPLAITAAALLATWILTYPSVTALRYPGV
jgi:hypothetical protein